MILLSQIALLQPPEPSKREQQGQTANERLHAASTTGCGAALALGAAEHFVGGEAEKTGDDLGYGKSLAVTFIPRVGAKDFDRLLRHATRGVELEFNRGRKTFELTIMGLSIDDQRDDRPLRMKRLEGAYLLVDVMTLSGRRRADDDERRRRIERGTCLLVERMTGGEIVAVAEDGAKRRRYRSGCGLAADQILVDGKRLKRTMQPSRPVRVGVAVGNEGAVFELGDL